MNNTAFQLRLKYGINIPETTKKNKSAQDKSGLDLFTKENSIAAYDKIKPFLTQARVNILNIVEEHGPCTMHEVAKRLNVELNTISGRFGELVKMGALEIIGKTPDNKSIYKSAKEGCQ